MRMRAMRVGIGFGVAGAAATLFAACGGTTGHEGLTAGGPAAADQDATTAPIDAGIVDATVDVTIMYADAARLWGYEDAYLPEAAVSSEASAGGEAGAPPLETLWPVCGCDSQDGPDQGRGTLLLSDGGMPDTTSGFCARPEDDPDAAYSWTGNPACDECLIGAGQVVGVQVGPSQNIPIRIFPPCCSLTARTIDAGANPLPSPAPTGESDWQACARLWTCMTRNGLTVNAPPSSVSDPRGRLFCGAPLSNCLNGAVATGPCAEETFEAFGLAPNAMNTRYIAENAASPSFGPGVLGFAAAPLYIIAGTALLNCAEVCSLSDAGP
jgi:hypothetical protein